jgi:YHS domain-containing protein
MHGEFENNDPIGLAAGVKIPADCSLNWKDPDSGKLYCFSSATSLVYFLNAPQSYISRAKSNWKALAASKH